MFVLFTEWLFKVTLNELMHRVAHDEAFLRETLKGTIQVDEFTGNLFKIWETVLNEGIKQVSCSKVFNCPSY